MNSGGDGPKRVKPGGNSPEKGTTGNRDKRTPMDSPKPHECGAKTRRKNEDGTPKLCTNPGTGTGGRCRLHGGASLVGAALPQFVNGGRSKYMPDVSAARFLEAEQDQRLFTIRQDLALVEAALVPFLKRMPKTEQQLMPAKLEKRMLELLAERRRLIEAEANRVKTLAQTISLPQAQMLVQAVVSTIRKFVPEEDKRRAFQQELAKLLKPARPAVPTYDDSD